VKDFGLRSVFAAIALAFFSLCVSAPASAQATRTWISGVGDDANPCSRTAPCKTFAGAVSKTAAQGEVNCIDPGGFGAVTITKSITLSCEGVTGGVLVAQTNGIVVNAAPGDVVRIRGLDIEGLSTIASGSFNGILFSGGGTLHVSNTRINGFGVNTNEGFGISFTPNSNAALIIDNVELTRHGSAINGLTSGAVLIKPAAGVTAAATISNSVIANSGNVAVRADISGNAGAVVSLTIAHSVLSNDGVGVLAKAPAGTGTVTVMVNNSTIDQNGNIGIFANGPGATVRVGNSTITGSATGVITSAGGTINSYGNNLLDGNTANGSFSGTIPPR
jgi:hypothetical protein